MPSLKKGGTGGRAAKEGWTGVNIGRNDGDPSRVKSWGRRVQPGSNTVFPEKRSNGPKRMDDVGAKAESKGISQGSSTYRGNGKEEKENERKPISLGRNWLRVG